jgi:hypothetical protein
LSWLLCCCVFVLCVVLCASGIVRYRTFLRILYSRWRYFSPVFEHDTML